MKKSLTMLTILAGALVLVGCQGQTTDDQNIIFKTEATTGKITHEGSDSSLVVYYVNDATPDVKFDLAGAAQFSVGENAGNVEKFRVIDGVLYYPNREQDPVNKNLTINMLRPVKLDQANGKRVYEINQVLFDANSEALAAYGWDKIKVGDYIDLNLTFDFKAPTGGILPN